ncbi:MAG TPA: 3'-5' exonuclease, partial [Gemmatimonas sp.]|nr:3'-5' exonuclease [Gemmatimonas sp.]
MSTASQDEWLWGWDPTPGIVSVWAEGDGTATVWRRVDGGRTLVCERSRFRPWMLLDSLADLEHLGRRLRLVDERREPASDEAGVVHYRELSGTGALRYLASASRLTTLTSAVLDGAAQRTGTRVASVRDLGEDRVFVLPPDEQYLVSSGRTYFRDLSFDQLHRLQFDLETTGLDPEHSRMFMVAVRTPSGELMTLEAENDSRAAEGALIRRLLETIAKADPDVIENHNLHGFDLPFLVVRARVTGVPLVLGRTGRAGLLTRGAQRG